MQKPLSVSELNNQIKSLLESTFLYISVEGEVSRVTYHSSGHLYFSLKDKNSSISCVMFRGNNAKLKFRVEEGLKVIVQGAISVYTPRGSYQINCISMEPSGSGALALAYEQLKKKLEAKGYFNNKKELPRYPKLIALITSKTGAALQDMLRVAKKRWPLTKLILIDTLVQGEEAKNSIANSIKLADKLNADIIVVSRGGGSVEDLWAFNEEIVADAIYKAKTPIVSAVGHEIDFLISDFVADLRAPTPSAAMEMILPDINEMRIYTDNTLENFHNVFKRVILKKSEELKNIYYSYRQNSIPSRFELLQREILSTKNNINQRVKVLFEQRYEELSYLKREMTNKMANILLAKEQLLNFALSNLEANKPQKKLKESYAQIVKNNKPTPLKDIAKDEVFELVSPEVKIEAKAISKTAVKA